MPPRANCSVPVTRQSLGDPSAKGKWLPPMNLKQRIFRNSSLENGEQGRGHRRPVSSYLLILIHSLTKETYGLWVLIGSVVGYFGFTDFGVRMSTGRMVAFYRGKSGCVQNQSYDQHRAGPAGRFQAAWSHC